MTTPIKPPGQGVATTSTPDVDASRGPGSAKSTGESFQSTLEKTSQASSSRAPVAADALRSLVDDLKAGRTTVDAALDRLVARALDSGMAKSLSAARRVELEKALRSALLEDPSLQALSKEMERGR